MPTVRYGGKSGAPIELVVDPELVVVRTHSRTSLRSGPVSRPEAAFVADTELVVAHPEAGVEVFRRRPESRFAADEIRRELVAFPDTRFAGHVLTKPESGEPVLYTENLFVKFQDDEDREHCQTVLREAGLAVKAELTYAPNAYFVEAPEGTGQAVFEIAERLLERDDVELCHPELIERLEKRAIAPQQWHLRPSVVNGVAVDASANVAAAHLVTEGQGTVIAVIDDGFDLDHEEFSSAGKIVAPRDFQSLDDNPRPGSDDDHGTACAGVACADGRFGASGVAPKAKLMPLRMPQQIGSQRNADAFVWAADHGADVISCSWGPADGRWWNPNDPVHNQVVPIADNIRLAIDYATERGRGGKGCVIFFAAGNGNESVDNDGYASYPKVLAVAASNDRSRRSVYSDFGRAVWLAFPSNDFGWPQQGRPEPLTSGIWTTDRTGHAGYNPNPDTGAVEGDAELKYTNGFGGTSSACPGAAGVAALVLAQNPELRWQEVRDILRRACERIDPQGGQYDAQGRSPFYGWGRVNAATAVTLATPQPVANGVVVERQVNAPIRDHQTTTVALEVTEAAPLAALTVRVELEHTFVGDLAVRLHPPAATGVTPILLHDRTGGNTQNLAKDYDTANTPALAPLVGQSPLGAWTLEVRDEAAVDEGAVRRLRLTMRLA